MKLKITELKSYAEQCVEISSNIITILSLLERDSDIDSDYIKFSLENAIRAQMMSQACLTQLADALVRDKEDETIYG